jgi:thiamine transport system permease protein
MNAAGNTPRAWLVLPVLLFLAAFYVYPLWEILTLGLGKAAEDLSTLAPLLSSYYPRVIFFTFWQAALSSLLTVVAALPGAWLLARHDFPGKGLFEALVTIPFVLPTVVVAAAFRTLADPDALLGSLLTRAGLVPDGEGQGLVLILAAHVFYNFSLALRIVGSFWAHLPPAMAESARMAGATPWQAFRTVTLPLLAPALGAAGLLVFIFCFSSFGVVLLLGGFRYSTLEVEIYRQAAHVFNLPLAATLSLIQLLVTWAVMLAQSRFQERSARPLSPAASFTPLGRTPDRTRRFGRAYLALALTTLVVPMASLALESLRPDQAWSLSGYAGLVANPLDSLFHVPPMAAMGNSLLYALTAAALAVPLGLCAAVFVHTRTPLARALDPLLMLPMTTSAVTLGFGFIIALDQPPLHLRSSWFLVPVAHALVAFPFVLRTVLPALSAVPAGLREAAATLGAGPWKVWVSIDLPLLARATLLGAVYSFVISLGEFGATIFIARPHTPTLPMAIYKSLSLPGSQHHAQALAAATLLMAMCAVCFLVLERCKRRMWGNF